MVRGLACVLAATSYLGTPANRLKTVLVRVRDQLG
jgi:hypothetical protein